MKASIKTPKKILYVQFLNPAYYPPLLRSCNIFLQNGYECLFAGIICAETADITARKELQGKIKCYDAQKRNRLSKWDYIGYLFWVLKIIFEYKPNCIYVSDPISTPVGVILASLFPKVTFIYHEHDSLDVAYQNMSSRFIRALRNNFLKWAHICIVPNEKRIIQLKREVKFLKPIYCVWNCPNKKSVRHEPKEELSKRPLRLVYQGSINESRMPLTIIEAMAKFEVGQITLTMIGYESPGSKGHIKKIEEMAKKLGIEDSLEIKGSIEQKEIEVIGDTMDVGLALIANVSYDINSNFLTGASNKPFEYLARGVAVLVNDAEDWKTFYVEPGFGLSCNPNDSESIKNVFEWMLNNRSAVRTMGENGRLQALKKWNYEEQFDPVLKKLKALLSD